jgi:hypothetical protein
MKHMMVRNHNLVSTQFLLDSSPPPQPSPVDVSREPKRLKTNKHKPLPVRSGPVALEKQGKHSVNRRSGAVKMQNRLTSTIIHRDFRSGPSTKIAALLRVKDAAPRPVNAVKRPHIHCSRAPSSNTKQTWGISALRIELVIITDTEPESSEDKTKESSCRNIAYKVRTLGGKAT